jgi:succinate-acetate transporter protein
MSEKTANPAPLGLLGFGVTTVLLNFVHNAQLTSSPDAMILAMGLAYGGLAQIIAGVMEYRRGNTFGMVAFTSYGLFWWSFVFLDLLPLQYFFYGIPSASHLALMAYFSMWGLFTLAMIFGTLKKNRALQFVFISLTILFFLLATREGLVSGQIIAAGDANWNLFTQITGIEGIICGLSAVYLAIAEILNETYGKTVLPIGPVS